ncbi:MAG TPA: hypothetical protein VF269_06220 [Rhodanobacteraceae bacterium]
MPHFYGAVGTPSLGLHRWQPHSRHPLVLGSGYGSRLARVMLHEMRWRDPPREWALRISAMVLTLLLHLLMLALMALVQPAGYPPQGSQSQLLTMNVRLIEQTKPPPPPPPIKLLRLKVRPAHGRLSPNIKRAPVAAMPPVPTPALAVPKLAVTADKLHLTRVPVVTVPPRVKASPPARTMPPIAMPTPPKVVLEVSSQALAPPKVQKVQLVAATVPSPALQPIPAAQVAPQVTLGKTRVKMQITAALPVQVQAPTRVQVILPSLPTVKPATTPVQITPTNVTADVAKVQVTLTPSVHVTSSLPVMPALDLPVAKVPVPQAPPMQTPSMRVQAPSVVRTPTITITARVQPAHAVSAIKPALAKVPSVKAPATTSWAPANDRFKPVTGRQGQLGASHNPSSQPEGVVELMPRGNSNVMVRNSDHLGYKPTIFSQYWAPANESILDSFLRHLIDKLTVTHTFHVAPGIRVHCALGPMLVFFACGGDPPRPKSADSNDRRLDMAPARPLVPGLGAPAPTTSAPTVRLDNSVECTVARVAGSPPPPGCPGAPTPPSQSDQWHAHAGTSASGGG